MTRAIDPTLPRFPGLRAARGALLAASVLAGSACSGGATEREPACDNLLTGADVGHTVGVRVDPKDPSRVLVKTT
jgi:hypothetical protein